MTRCLGLAIKRFIDFSIAAIGLLALSPVLALLSVINAFVHGWPPFFVQPRPGKGERVFHMAKLRSMTNERGPDGELLPDADRLTRFGQFLRKTSLDELPGLWSVLRGDMSLIGPRPLLVDYLPLYSKTQNRRHEMRPGITGLAQVSGRNAQTWSERLHYDVTYVDDWSLMLDAKILWKTVRVVLGQEGVSADGDATMPRFQGAPDFVG
ncbi:MAG: lipopolysaccharide/colanic/teichoic acid biosynthesis glycosyltransferase [Bradymonadia bacterium]|jgi:lipopolysaccharide/colanic/teichoic acid biosynthesis glycosyltransferase